MAELSPRTVSLEQDYLSYARKEEVSSEAKSIEIELAPEDHEVIKEAPQILEVTISREITKVPEVNIEPPQIDLSLAWKIFIDEAKNSLEAKAGVDLKSPEGAIFKHCLKLKFPTTNNEAEYEAFIV
ncbi:hypothetical protein Acr_10g0007830 [Actinidia rufa]|uniref:Uncharacterized protein n=1 Tax=Actinidia rufa TaxID=165716 RepID=A0A7J0F9M0_9ERIC|nr:hypothetical protein Acr_10g0007830 [Actinidia rufa]